MLDAINEGRAARGLASLDVTLALSKGADMRRIGVAIIEVQRDAGTSGRPAPNGSKAEASAEADTLTGGRQG
jgi:hypothetical protein